MQRNKTHRQVRWQKMYKHKKLTLANHSIRAWYCHLATKAIRERARLESLLLCSRVLFWRRQSWGACFMRLYWNIYTHTHTLGLLMWWNNRRMDRVFICADILMYIDIDCSVYCAHCRSNDNNKAACFHSTIRYLLMAYVCKHANWNRKINTLHIHTTRYIKSSI